MRCAKVLLTAAILTFSSPVHPGVFGSGTHEAIAENGITVDLREPLFHDGVLSTEKGGVIRAADIRIQAQKIRYITKDGQIKIEAEDELMLERGDLVFVAEKMEYDFNTKEGILYGARTSVDAWFVGGKIVELRSDGSFRIKNAFISTCENVKNEWQILSKQVTVHRDNTVEAESIQFRFIKLPVFWFPSFRGNLRAFFDAPLRYRFSVGGHNRFLASFRYRMFSLESLHAYLRADYRARRGPGVGIETEFRRPDLETQVLTRSYIAHDGSLFDHTQSTRYRLEGDARSRFGDELRYAFHLRWDKLSDEDMPTDYQERDFDLGTAGRTEMRIRRQDQYWLANFQARARVNSFQTVKQELPGLHLHARPINLGTTGFIVDNRAEIAYIDLKFADDLVLAHNYSAFRAEYFPRLYRPIALGPCTFTPEADFIGIFYGNGPQGEEWLATGKIGGAFRTHLYKATPDSKALLTPYVSAYHWPEPTLSPTQHYIFDEDDGWTKLNHVEMGVDYQVFKEVQHRFSSRLWMDWFPYTPTFESNWHRLHAQFIWDPFPTARHMLETSFDVARQLPSTFNWRSSWSFTKDLAFAAELRYRDSWTWRKANPRRFMMEAYEPENVLHKSRLSDKRNTLLLHAFWRLDPSYAVEVKSRHGWNRRIEPDYNEYFIALHTVLRCQWQVELSWTHRESDQRFGIYMYLREGAPRRPKSFLKPDDEYPEVSDFNQI